jgi:hypothetical protein
MFRMGRLRLREFPTPTARPSMTAGRVGGRLPCLSCLFYHPAAGVGQAVHAVRKKAKDHREEEGAGGSVS